MRKAIQAFLVVLGSAILALVVALVLAGITASGVNSMTLTTAFFWIAFVIAVAASGLATFLLKESLRHAIAVVIVTAVVTGSSLYWLDLWLQKKKNDEQAKSYLPVSKVQTTQSQASNQQEQPKKAETRHTQKPNVSKVERQPAATETATANSPSGSNIEIIGGNLSGNKNAILNEDATAHITMRGTELQNNENGIVNKGAPPAVSCTNGICAGEINGGTQTVTNNYGATPLTISDEQQKKLSEAVSKFLPEFTNQKINISILDTSPETADFGNRISAAFDSAGFQTNTGQVMTFGTNQRGVTIRFGSKRQDIAEAVREVLVSSGVVPQVYRAEPMSEDDFVIFVSH